MCADITRLLSSRELEQKSRAALDLYVKHTGTIKGRGVFASRPYDRGELVESAPVIVFNACTLPRAIAHVLYNWEQHTGEKGARALALGYGSLYNHDNPSNLSYQIDAGNKVIRYTAARSIAADEELTINYNAANGQCEPSEDRWFERHGVERWAPSR